MIKSDYNASAIRTMEGIEHVRARPGMYGFVPDEIQGNVMQLKETLDNSVDEALDRDHKYLIEVTFFVQGNRYQAVTRDYGRGVPLEKLEPAFSKLFTSGKYEDGSYEISVGTNGVGSKVTAALSNRFVAMTKRPDGFGYFEMKKGKKADLYIRKKRVDTSNQTNGTIVFLEPDPTVLLMTPHFLEQGGIEQHIKLIKFVDTFSKNITIVVRKHQGLIPESFWKQDKHEIWKQLATPQGEVIYQSDPNRTVQQYVQEVFGLNKTVTWTMGPLEKLQRSESKEDRLSYSIEFFMDEKSTSKHGLLAAINRTPIDKPDSSHMKTVMMMLKQNLSPFIEDKDMLLFFENHYELPISGAIIVGWRRASFIGQDKRQFKDTEFEVAFRSSLRRQLAKQPEAIWETMFEQFADDLVEKYNKYANRNLKVGHGLKGIGFTLNNVTAYASCESTDRTITELFIAEGDSAGGRIKAVRDENFQAIFKLKGKPFNAIKGSREKLFENLIYQDLVRLIGVGPKDKTLDNMNFSKLIIATDADHDGAHIAALVVGMIYRINPLILEQGRVYIANPPLYGIVTRDRKVFLRDQAAMDEARIDNIYRELFEIELAVGDKSAPLHGDAFKAFCQRVIRIGNVLNSVSKTTNVEPLMLEQLLHVVQYLDRPDKHIKEICDTLHMDNAVHQKSTNNLVLVADDIEMSIPLEHLTRELRAWVLPEYEAIHWRSIELFVTTKHSELYINSPTTPMKLFRDFSTVDSLFRAERYKGLGEMDRPSLEYTCVNPATRCFTRLLGIGSVEKIYDMLGVDSGARKKLVNSKYVDGGDEVIVAKVEV